jgi:PAS domain-containing protein
MIDFLLNHIQQSSDYLYSIILQLVLVIGPFLVFLVFLKKFDVVPIFKYLIASFWLMVSMFWLINVSQTILQLNNVSDAHYLSYAGIFIITIQSIIIGTYLLSAIFQYFRFSPIFFLISLIYHTIALMIFFVQKNIFVLNQDHWLSQYTIADSYSQITLYVLGLPFIIFLITIIIQNLYFWFSKRYHPLHRLNLHITFTIVVYFSFFTLYYYDFTSNWSKILFLLAILIAPLFAYLLLIKNPAYQEDIINAQDYENKLQVNLLLKLLGGQVIAIAIPLSIANLLIYVYYSAFAIKLNGAAPTISSEIFQHAIIINAMIIVFSVAFNSIMAKILIYRIQDLIKGTQEVQRENFNYYIEATGHDELSVLTRSFNSMVATLKNYKQELKNYSTILESEIEKQTLELRKKRHEAEILAEQNMTLYKQLQKQTNTIIDNITDSLIAVDDQNRIMSINRTFSEKFDINDDYSGQEITALQFVKQYEIDKVMAMFREQKLKKYNFRLDLTKPYYGTMQCYMSAIDLENDKIGILLLMQDTTPPWGTVLNANTYEPLNLAIVRLFDYDSNKLVETAVTDDNGRFGFFVKPGRYYLTTDKENFHFPSRNRSGYHGEIIEVRTKEEGIIKVNILLDPLENVRLGIQADPPAPSNSPIVPPVPNEPAMSTIETPSTKVVAAAPSLMSNIPDVPMGPNVQQAPDNFVDSANLVGLGQAQTAVPTPSTPSVTQNIPTTTNTIPTIPVAPTNAAAPIGTSNAPTAISDRARAAKEAKKAELGNKNIEEKPGAMLEKIEQMIEEEKKVKGADDDINGAVTKAL